MEGARQRIGDKIMVQRKAAKLSRERLAAHAGLSAVTVYKVEHGENATYDTLAKIADALDVSVSKLVE